MSDSLPAQTSRQVLRVLGRAGWHHKRQSGSHIILARADGTGRVIVPRHPGDIPEPTLRDILSQADLTPSEFNRLRRGRP